MLSDCAKTLTDPETLQVRRHPTEFSSCGCVAARSGIIEKVASATGFDPWFVEQTARARRNRDMTLQQQSTFDQLPADLLRRAKREGFSDRTIADVLSVSESAGARET